MSVNAKINGRRAYRVIAERALSRELLPTQVIHHFDEDRSNNSPDNLVICPDQKYHQLLHRRSRALAACGDPNKRMCYLCKAWDSTDNLSSVLQRARNAEFYYHKACATQNYHDKKAKINPRRNLIRRGEREEVITDVAAFLAEIE